MPSRVHLWKTHGIAPCTRTPTQRHNHAPLQVESSRRLLEGKRTARRLQEGRLREALAALHRGEAEAEQQLEAALETLVEVQGETFMW